VTLVARSDPNPFPTPSAFPQCCLALQRSRSLVGARRVLRLRLAGTERRAGVGKRSEDPPAFLKEDTVVLLWVLVALLLLFAIVGGVAISKFLFFVLIVAVLLAVIGLFTRTA
jgi:hypothetical protein